MMMAIQPPTNGGTESSWALAAEKPSSLMIVGEKRAKA